MSQEHGFYLMSEEITNIFEIRMKNTLKYLTIISEITRESLNECKKKIKFNKLKFNFFFFFFKKKNQ